MFVLSYSFSLRFMLYMVLFALTAYFLIIFGDQRSQISLQKRNSLRVYSNQPRGDSRFIDMRYHHGFSSHQYRMVSRNCNLFIKRFKLFLSTSWLSPSGTLRRGVRSDAQLSCTETRFLKCSQSVKDGSKHPMLSIYMAYNVISCKKIERNTQKIKIADFTM